jgi:hypothetical protein
MIISLPDDGKGILYPIVDLNGQTVHTYRDYDAAVSSREGDHRIYLQNDKTGGWINGMPTAAAWPFPSSSPKE